MKQIFLFLIVIPFGLFSFQDPYSQMEIDIPEGFCLDSSFGSAEDEDEDGDWFYLFTDENENELLIDFTKSKQPRTLIDFFYQTLLDEYDNSFKGELVVEDLIFKCLKIGERDFVKSKARVLMLGEKEPKPYFNLTYQAVYKNYSVSFEMIKKNVKNQDGEDLDQIMERMLSTLRFPSTI